MKTDGLSEDAVAVLTEVTALVRTAVNNAAYVEPGRWGNLARREYLPESKLRYIGARFAMDAAGALRAEGDALRRAEEDAKDEADE